MDLLNMLINSGGENSLDQLSGKLGLSVGDAGKVVAAVAPALSGSLQKQVSTASGLAGLQSALATGGHDRYLENPELLQSESTVDDGNKILGHLFGSKQVSRDVAQSAAGQTGIDAGIIKKALPLVASLAMGAVQRNVKSDSQAGPSSGMAALASLLLPAGESKGAASSIMGFARKLF